MNKRTTVHWVMTILLLGIAVWAFVLTWQMHKGLEGKASLLSDAFFSYEAQLGQIAFTVGDYAPVRIAKEIWVSTKSLIYLFGIVVTPLVFLVAYLFFHVIKLSRRVQELVWILYIFQRILALPAWWLDTLLLGVFRGFYR